MLKQFRYSLPALLFIFSLSLHAQQNKIDSLQDVHKKLSGKTGYTADTSLYRIYMNIAKYWQGINTDSAQNYHQKSLEIALRINDDLRHGEALNGLAWDTYAKGDSKKSEKIYMDALVFAKKHTNSSDKKKKRFALMQESGVYGNLGIVYANKGDFEQALKYYDQALQIKKKIKDTRGEGITSNNTGNLYLDLANYPQALSCYYTSLKCAREIRNTSLEASALSNIGIVHMNMKEYPRALKYFRDALTLANRTGNIMNKSACLTNIGIIYHEMKDLTTALDYYRQALKYDTDLGNLKSQANNLMNIGAVYYDLKQFNTALQHYTDAKKIYTEFESEYGIASATNSIGMVLSETKEFRKAEQFLVEAQKKATELHALDLLKESHNFLSALYEETHRPEKALYHYKQYVVFRDSIFNEENTKAKIQKEVQFSYDKKAAADSVAFALKLASEKKIKDVEIAKGEAELKAKKFQQYILFGGLALVLVFSFFIYNRFRITQKQKLVIEQKEKETSLQKQVIEEKHREITDSINYAERIQRSFLASRQTLDQNLDDYFVFFQPKDVVSGDFYWATLRQAQGRPQFLLACADSTGHGVPGAIMSILNITCLEKAAEHNSNPAEILNETRKMIIERLKKDGSTEGGKDGMDCVLLNFDMPNKSVQFALANNSLWLVRHGEMHAYEADKMPVGKHDKQDIPFTPYQVNLQKDDLVYIFTDGYADQFGGDKGKKMKHTSLKKILMENSHEPMDVQHQKLQETFDRWKGDLEQVDDVCIIGIRIKG